ncbi:MAG: sulfatase-like hydrolase/transferase [Planctomycetota bacterium]
MMFAFPKLPHGIVAFLCILGQFQSTGSAADRPNFVLIMCDDLGWSDVGFNGGTHIRTPHLDAMAANGAKFNRFYAQAPVCSPTRASIVTGRHHDRTGIYTANRGHLRAGEFTLYEALSQSGYTTGHFGKWHMGTLTRKIADSNRGMKKPEDYSPPWEHAVGTTFATEAKTPTYDPMWKPDPSGDKKSFDAGTKLGWLELTASRPQSLYGTFYWTAEETSVPPESESLRGDDSRLIMDQTLKFIEREHQQPFLAIVWFHAPHLPVVTSEKDASLYDDGKTTPYEQAYYGCVSALDRQIGRLRKRLRELGIAENTVITFCSDNGPEGNDKAPGRAGQFRGRKRSLYEGGVRVPGLIEWPGKIPPGIVTDAAACTVDYFQTIQEIVGFELPDQRPMDGTSLLPLLDGRQASRPVPLAFHYQGKGAWHDGDWKAIGSAKKDEWELYNLSADPGETSDLAKQNPDRLRAMRTQWGEWKKSVDRSDSGADYR